MLKRVLVGATILLVAVTCFMLDCRGLVGERPWCTAALGGLLALGSLAELLTMGGARGALRMLVWLLGAAWFGVQVLAALRPDGPWRTAGDVLTGASIVAGLVALARIPAGPGESAARLARHPLFALAYAGGVACLVRLALGGALEFAVGVVLVAKSSDIGAYFTGKFLGKHPLAPRISPKKTIEGAVGGLVLPALLALLLLRPGVWGCDPSPAGLLTGAGAALLLGLGIAAIAIVSDLSESLFKRACGVKDSGHMLGEAGGMLDLADSLLLVGPFALAYTALLG